MNEQGIKVGDIFCLERSGSSGHHADFFQVVGLRGKKQIAIREINKKEVEYGMAVPIKDDFKKDSWYVKDNLAATKVVKIREEERDYEDSSIYISFSKYYSKSYYDPSKVSVHNIYEEAYLYRGNPKRDLLEWLD